MRKVYTSDDSVFIGHVRRVLENNAIRCIIRNDFLLGGAGELPINETWPEIWVVDDRDFKHACAPRRRGRVGGERIRSPVALRIVRGADGRAVHRLLALRHCASEVRGLMVGALAA